MEEIWKDIPEYEGLYQVSSLGRVKSLPRIIISKKGGEHIQGGHLLKLTLNNNGYYSFQASKNGKGKTKFIHQQVAMVFLNHKSNGHSIVIDHINDDKSDNRVENLQIVTQRFNCRKTQGKYTSQYKGVHYHKRDKVWCSAIMIDGKKIHLGNFHIEEDAGSAYQNALQNLEQ